MNLSQFQEPIRHGRGPHAGPAQARDHGGEIVLPVEAVFELGEVARDMLAVGLSQSFYGTPVDFLRTANRDLDAAKRFFRKMLEDQPLLGPDRIGTDGAGPYPPAIAESRKEGLLPRTPIHYVTKHLQQGIESDHFRVKKNMPRIGGFQSFNTARRAIQGFEAMLWLRKGFGFAGAWTVCEQNRLLAVCFGLQAVNKV